MGSMVGITDVTAAVGQVWNIKHECQALGWGTWGLHWQVVCRIHGGITRRSKDVKDAIEWADYFNEQERGEPYYSYIITDGYPAGRHTRHWTHSEEDCLNGGVGWKDLA